MRPTMNKVYEFMFEKFLLIFFLKKNPHHKQSADIYIYICGVNNESISEKRFDAYDTYF